jgi:hemerythrin
MSFMEWQDSFALGIEKFDGHHRQLIDLINKTYDEISRGATTEHLDSVLLPLSNYATYHFASEERWMSLHGYPDLLKHQKEHFLFSNKIVELREAFYSEKPDVLKELLQFLVTWLTNHILDSDAHYGRFAREIPGTSAT